MDIEKIRKLYCLRQQINNLEREEEQLTREIKEEMILHKISDISIDTIKLELKLQCKTIIDNSIISFLKAKGLGTEINDYVKEKGIYYLYVKSTEK